MKLQGQGPWQLADDLDIIFTPGHTPGCCSLLYRPDKTLFTGDHLAYSRRLDRLTIFRAYNWHSVPEQVASVAKLVDLEFLTVLPGHGRRWRCESAEQRRAALSELVALES
jgi:glyoxylase-like metal-dependent hydrolase (beta-lactamase superfamily II)